MQAIGKCNMFQAAFVYVKIIKVLYADGGVETLNTTLTFVVENLVVDGNWQTGASSSNTIAFEDI